MNTSNRYVRILALDPCQAGFAFIVFEGGARLVDWGIAQVWSKAEAALLNRVEQFVDRYTPSLLVLESTAGSRLGRVARKKIDAAAKYAQERRLRVVFISRKAVKRVFDEHGKNRLKIATAIVEAFPELAPRLPRPRRAWMGEDQRLHIFDAFALALSLPPNYPGSSMSVEY